MKLLLDIGNTRIKSALLTAQGLSEQHAIAHAGLDSAQLRTRVLDEYASVQAVWVSNVAGTEIGQCITQAAYDQWQIQPTFVSSTAQCGAVRNAYPEPEKLGVDRWLALIGTHAMNTSNPPSKQWAHALIVSVGTAMTIDALAANGVHRGGLIVPGPDLMMRSLMHHTSDIATHALNGEQGTAFFANNTLGAVYQGAVYACAALVDAAYAQLAATEPTHLVLTGGGAELIAPRLTTATQQVPALIPDLVLRGLAVLANAAR